MTLILLLQLMAQFAILTDEQYDLVHHVHLVDEQTLQIKKSKSTICYSDIHNGLIISHNFDEFHYLFLAIRTVKHNHSHPTQCVS